MAPIAVQANTVEEAIEPEETDEILEVLNRGQEEADPLPASQAPSPAGARSLQTCVPFEHNDFELTFPGMLELEKVAELMQAYPASTIHL